MLTTKPLCPNCKERPPRLGGATCWECLHVIMDEVGAHHPYHLPHKEVVAKFDRFRGPVFTDIYQHPRPKNLGD